MRLPLLATQALTSHIFVPLPFQRPPAPIADTSTSPPLLVAQAAQALQPFSPNVTKSCGLQPKQARSCLRLQHRPSHVFSPVTPNPFFLPVTSIADASARLLLLVVQTHPQPFPYPNPFPYPWPAAPLSNSSMRTPPLEAQAHISQASSAATNNPFSFK